MSEVETKSREPLQNEPIRLQDTQIRDYMASLYPLKDGAILRGDCYTLCPDCTRNEAAGRYGETAICSNAAFRLINPNLSFSKGNIMLVCCAVNQVARNQNHEAPNVKNQIRLLSMRMKRAADNVPAERSWKPSRMTCKCGQKDSGM